MDDLTQMKSCSRNGEMIRGKINHSLIHENLIISALNIIVGNQIHSSDVDQRITSSYFSRNWILTKRKLIGTRKILKLVRTYQQK